MDPIQEKSRILLEAQTDILGGNESGMAMRTAVNDAFHAGVLFASEQLPRMILRKLDLNDLVESLAEVEDDFRRQNESAWEDAGGNDGG